MFCLHQWNSKEKAKMIIIILFICANVLTVVLYYPCCFLWPLEADNASAENPSTQGQWEDIQPKPLIVDLSVYVFPVSCTLPETLWLFTGLATPKKPCNCDFWKPVAICVLMDNLIDNELSSLGKFSVLSSLSVFPSASLCIWLRTGYFVRPKHRYAIQHSECTVFALWNHIYLLWEG